VRSRAHRHHATHSATALAVTQALAHSMNASTVLNMP
jgi:hypothetical protein